MQNAGDLALSGDGKWLTFGCQAFNGATAAQLFVRLPLSSPSTVEYAATSPYSNPLRSVVTEDGVIYYGATSSGLTEQLYGSPTGSSSVYPTGTSVVSVRILSQFLYVSVIDTITPTTISSINLNDPNYANWNSSFSQSASSFAVIETNDTHTLACVLDSTDVFLVALSSGPASVLASISITRDANARRLSTFKHQNMAYLVVVGGTHVWKLTGMK
jgi:hypothetical protein